MKSKRKLFLSWMAVRQALMQGEVTEQELGECLFATSVGELILGDVLYTNIFARIYPHLRTAAQEGRLVYDHKIDHLNEVTFASVDELLKRCGFPPLNWSAAGTLSLLQHGMAVPECEDASLQVLWQGQPSSEEMREARRLQDEELRALVAGGGKPNFGSVDWMSEIRLSIAQRG